jgi:hypothetical protein
MPIAAQVFEAWAYAAATKRVSDAPARRSDLVDEIMSHESATMAGLVVIARAVVMELSDWWTSEYCEHDAARVFMEAFCVFCGHQACTAAVRGGTVGQQIEAGSALEPLTPAEDWA